MATAFPSSHEPMDLIRAWVLEHALPHAAAPIDEDTPLLEAGYIDSLGFLGLIVYVESLTGNSLTEAEMRPECFTSLNVIDQTFFRRAGKPLQSWQQGKT